MALALGFLGLERLSHGPRPKVGVRSGAAAPSIRLGPLAAERELVELDVPGAGRAFVRLPLGATEPRPLVIALHGAEDHPEPTCKTWGRIAGPRPFILCPRGEPSASGRYGWSSPAAVERELRAALRALKQRYGAHVSPGSVVLAAFSAGVRPALEIARQEATFFQRLVLVSPESESWSAGRAGAYAKSGGQKVVFAVSEAASRRASDAYLVFARGAGLGTKMVDVGERGVVFDEAVERAIAPEFAWLVADDPRYAP